MNKVHSHVVSFMYAHPHLKHLKDCVTFKGKLELRGEKHVC